MKFVISTAEYKPNRLYLVEFRDDTGYYIKCGKSSGSSSEDRFISIIKSYITSHGGNCAYAKMLRDVEVSDVFKRETEFHHKFADRRHYPKHTFSGCTELFKITYEEAMEAFDEIVSRQYDRGPTKVCYSCKTEKSTIEFHTNKAKKDGLNHACKTCVIDNARSKTQLPYRIYNNQVLHSKSRGHPPPSYTYEEFKQWVLSNPLYDSMYQAYQDSDYDKNLVPSVDRLDASKHYTFDNIELVTWEENMRRHGEHTVTIMGNPVLVFSKYGEYVAEFPSNQKAADTLCGGRDISRIVDTVNKYGKLGTSHGYCFVNKQNENRFCINGWLLPEIRYPAEESSSK